VSGNIQQADYYMKKLLETEPTAYDYLNAGHVTWCQRNILLALEMYRKSLTLQQNNWELFLELLNKDKPYLILNGIDADEILLLLDELNPLVD